MNLAVLEQLNPETVKVEMRLVELPEEWGERESELDEIWSYVGKKSNPRWLLHALDNRCGKVLAYAFGSA